MLKIVVVFSLGILFEFLLLMLISVVVVLIYLFFEVDEVGDLVLGCYLYMLEDSLGILILDDVCFCDI